MLHRNNAAHNWLHMEVFLMQRVLPHHHKKVLATLQALDPVQTELSRQTAIRSRWVARFIAVLRYWHRRRATIQALKELPDWVLRDIGVLRSEIPSVVDAVLSAEPQTTNIGRRSKSRLAA
jgi:uncharacterized protein YjiS (DUF1127 family)